MSDIANALKQSKSAADKWAVLFRRALPECADVEEAVLVADVAFMSLDDAGHEHKGKGEDGGQFTGLGDSGGKEAAKPKHGSRAAALHAKHAELKQARIDAFNEVKADATTANEKANTHHSELQTTFNSGVNSDDHGFADAVDEHIVEYNPDATANERFEVFKDIEIAAKAAIGQHEGLDDAQGKENDASLKKIIESARAARQSLKAYVQHVKEMKAIKSGSSMDVQLSMMDEGMECEPMSMGLPIDAKFSWDIENRKAQGILNRAVRAIKKMTASARIDLEKSLKTDDPAELSAALLRFINKYRIQLADLLTTTQLAALLEGAREVAKSIPTVPAFPGGAVPPPMLEPAKAVELIDKLQAMPVAEREKAIYELPADQQQFARHGLIAKQQGPALPPPAFTPAPPITNEPERIHYPIIDEAAQELAAKNVMTRDQFDALDAAARQKAFTIAHVESLDTIAKVRDAMAETITEGVDLQSFREKVLAAVDEGTFMSDAHLENVFRTGVQTAFSDGQMTVLQHPFVKSGFPYASYEAIHDDRVRHNHLALMTCGLQGTNIYRIEDPVFMMFRPPWDYCDRCSWIPMTIRMAASKGIEEAKRWLQTGVEPTPPAFVAMPSFRPPVGFQRSLAGAPLSIQLACEPITKDKL